MHLSLSQPLLTLKNFHISTFSLPWASTDHCLLFIHTVIYTVLHTILQTVLQTILQTVKPTILHTLPRFDQGIMGSEIYLKSGAA